MSGFTVSYQKNFIHMPKKKTTTLFEDSLAELEQLVSQLEQGDISLEESLKSFERGVTLTRTCQKALQEAEQKVQILLEKNGNLSLESFTDE
jgi:exodeoxyribonuclease VII small subunit